jgi:hypothetical protein
MKTGELGRATGGSAGSRGVGIQRRSRPSRHRLGCQVMAGQALAPFWQMAANPETRNVERGSTRLLMGARVGRGPCNREGAEIAASIREERAFGTAIGQQHR